MVLLITEMVFCVKKILKKISIDDQVDKFYIINVSHEGRVGSKTRVLVAFLLWR